MANYNDNLPGGCFVNDIRIEQGIQLDPELYAPYFFKEKGFELNQMASVIITQQQILITTNPKFCNLITAINELQCRQDETGQDFEPSIIALLGKVVQRE